MKGSEFLWQRVGKVLFCPPFFLTLLLWRAGEPLLAPQEILVRILSLKKDEVPLKQHMAALTACLTMKMPDGAVAFPPQSLASTLQQLVIKCASWHLLSLAVTHPHA